MVDLKSEQQSPIDAHGIIGDMRSAALVNDKGSIDFFCWPEFDSPSVFCSLLDSPDAGIFQLTPDLPTRVASRSTCPTPTSCKPAGSATTPWWRSPTCWPSAKKSTTCRC